VTYNIGKGWLLVVDSWENDGDSNSTEFINLAVEDKAELDWLLAIMPYFQKSAWEKGPNGEADYYVGNIYDSVSVFDRLRAIMTEAFEKHWADNEYYVEFPDAFEPFEMLYNYGHAFLGMDDNQMTRKIASWKLYEVPEDISFKELASG
jgi:hypothetical protein